MNGSTMLGQDCVQQHGWVRAKSSIRLRILLLAATFNKRDLASLPVSNAARVTFTGNFVVGGEQVQINASTTLRVVN